MILFVLSSVGLVFDIGSEVGDRWRCFRIYVEIRSCLYGFRYW